MPSCGLRAVLQERSPTKFQLLPAQVTQRLEVPVASPRGGEQQLVAIARALMANPMVVIVEPLGLASKVIVVVRESLATTSGAA
jgi:ABC-type branched-subunit amino acid transport system ATPase component